MGERDSYRQEKEKILMEKAKKKESCGDVLGKYSKSKILELSRCVPIEPPSVDHSWYDTVDNWYDTVAIGVILLTTGMILLTTVRMSPSDLLRRRKRKRKKKRNEITQ
mmetsp:Transcript_43361/g.60870  ORF Transcript_43361/g.60870 Transcript_43361/m.60870 type:complete len:108 (+) Transcript_43361:267-590(+)